MSGKTLTKAEIVDAIYEKTDRNRAEVKGVVESLLGIMKQAIKKDHALLISGFGKFEAYDKKARKVIKTARWLLLRNRDTIAKDEDRVRLDELLAANEALMTAYVLKDDLKDLWRHTDPEVAKRAWQAWKERAMASAVKPLVLFARRLEPYLAGIIAHCRWPLHTSLLEGINNKIKVIKRMAYGFRDDDYFFLKVRAAFPGIRR